MKVILFGQLKELAASASLEAPEMSDSGQLRQWLETRFPTLLKLPYLLAINRKIIDDVVTIGADQEIAVLPPYSGG